MKKNRAKSLTNKAEMLYEEEMYGLADAIAESHPQTSAEMDPFEDYVHVVRTKIHSNPHIFRSRLVKGYNALLLVLQDAENTPN